MKKQKSRYVSYRYMFRFNEQKIDIYLFEEVKKLIFIWWFKKEFSLNLIGLRLLNSYFNVIRHLKTAQNVGNITGRNHIIYMNHIPVNLILLNIIGYDSWHFLFSFY